MAAFPQPLPSHHHHRHPVIPARARHTQQSSDHAGRCTGCWYYPAVSVRSSRYWRRARGCRPSSGQLPSRPLCLDKVSLSLSLSLSLSFSLFLSLSLSLCLSLFLSLSVSVSLYLSLSLPRMLFFIHCDLGPHHQTVLSGILLCCLPASTIS